MITDSTMQGSFASALLDAGLPAPSVVHAEERFAIHRNNFVSSLIDALADTFPVTQELVGATFFRAMASVFVRQSPPRSRVLCFYGDALPAFINTFSPASSVPYLGAVARLEHARVVAFHAADVAPLSKNEALQTIGAGERADRLVLSIHPSLVTCDSRHAVVSIWAAHQYGRTLEDIDIEVPESALVVRAGLDVAIVRVPIGVTAFVRAIVAGGTLGDAAGKALEADAGFDVVTTLMLLVRHDALVSMHHAEPAAA